MTAPIELVSVAHAAAMAAIHREAFPPQDSWSSDVFALQIASRGVFGLLDPRGGLILCRIAADESEVVTLAVVPAVRRRGVAKALLRAAMDHARRAGAVAMFLEVNVVNAPARDLYDSLGFAQVGRRRRYYANGADALVLRAPLTGEGQPGEGQPGGVVAD